MEDNEWEAIQFPSSGGSTTQSSASDEDVFPSTNHEGLPLTPPHEPIPATSSPPQSYSLTPSSSSSGFQEDETELPCQQEPETTDRLGILRFVYGIYGRFGIWSFVSVAAVLMLAAYGRRWRSWRRRVQKQKMDQMMLVINQKDEKIKQLLIQIDQMNEILSARKRVPVHRIVVDRPIMNRPRLDWKPT